MNKTKIILAVAIVGVGGFLLYRNWKTNKNTIGVDGGINYEARAKAIKSGRYWEDKDGNLFDSRIYPKPNR